MTQEEQREQAVQYIAGLLRNNPFSMELKVKKKPKGIRVIYEVTQEEMDYLVNKAAEKHKTKNKKK